MKHHKATVHTKTLKLYACQECRKRFNSESNLKAHMVTHSYKPFQCLECKMRFAVEEKLERHKCYKSRLKLHLCQHCGKGFNRPWLLRKHSMKCPAAAENTDTVPNNEKPDSVPNNEKPESVPDINEQFLDPVQRGDENLAAPKDLMSFPFFPNF